MGSNAQTDGAKATSNGNAGAAIVLFDQESGFLQRFDPRNNSLMKIHQMTSQMRSGWFTAVSLRDYIFVLNADKTVYRFKYFDKTATWERMSNMIEYHGIWPPAVAYLASIYVVGGNGVDNSCFVEKYDLFTDKWTRLQDKPQSARYSSVLASRGYIYCFGGELKQDGSYENSVQRFHLGSATWEDLPPMNEGRANTGVFEFGGKICVMGGGTRLQETNQLYDPATKQWAMLKPMRIPRWRFRCFPIEGCIYAVGGGRFSNTVEKYDVRKNEWEMVPLPRKGNLNFLESVVVTLYK